MEWKNSYRGLLIGICDLIPGVSGGTIAFLLGIYDRLLEAISGFFSREWKKHIGFLLPLVVGIAFALVVFSKLIDYLLKYHFEPTQFFFLGLIIGVLPFIMKQGRVKKHFTSRHFFCLVIVALLLATLAFIDTNSPSQIVTSLSFPVVWGLFFAGWAASMAMLLPGISGSFLLLLLGVYPTAINALSTLNLPIIITIGTGMIVGFIVSSKAILYLLTHYPHMTYAVIIGLICGSVFVMYPGLPAAGSMVVLCLLTFLTGLFFSFVFSLIRRT